MIEKAHLDVFNLLLQVMDKRADRCNNGRKADFRNVVLGDDHQTPACGKTERKSIGLIHQTTVPMRWARSRKCLRRSSATVSTTLFGLDHLSGEVIHQVVDKFIAELQAQLDQKGVFLLEVSQKRATGWRKRAATGRWAHDRGACDSG